jgi:hypothetical protein
MNVDKPQKRLRTTTSRNGDQRDMSSKETAAFISDL